MIIKPVSKGFICTTAHPDGCAKEVQKQIDYVKGKSSIEGPKKVLIIGASTGYGLASRIVATFTSGADTLGVFFERPSQGKRTASPGWYNSAAFEKEAQKLGRIAKSINGDAFSDEIKQKTVDMIKKDFGGKIDLIIYSLASPRRNHPKTGKTHFSTLKPIEKPFENKTVNFQTGQVTPITIEPATADEIENTKAVMGGEDWLFWMETLDQAGVLSQGAQTIAYSYIGPDITMPIYRDGTIGRAKDDLESTALKINEIIKKHEGRAVVSVNKALVTQASSAIPVVPLYISLLFKVMKEKKIHEGCIEQMYRLFSEHLYGDTPRSIDEKGRIRIDDWELRDDVQKEVSKLWQEVKTENLESISDIIGYRNDFFNLFGFKVPNIDYDADVNSELEIPSLQETAEKV